ncbi:MAG: IscS subfamily cysteine desulfurase [Nevskiales bacterium]
MIYLDYASTTPVAPEVLEAMLPWLRQNFGNPASATHAYGAQALQAVEQAREQLAALIHADPREIVWTSGATESNNLAIKGAAQAHAGRGKHLVTVRTEHKSVVDCYRQLEESGWRVIWLKPGADGLLDLAELENAFSSDTVLVSVMQVNNEIGVTQDIAAIAGLTRSRGILLHVDAAQALGKLPMDVNVLDVDLMSFSAHKLYGPKGAGALYVRRQPRARIAPQLHGGGHERGLRSGTLATHQVVGFGAACVLADRELQVEPARLAGLRERLWRGIRSLPKVYLNGHPTERVAGILNVSFDGVDGEALLAALALFDGGLAVSSGSACTSASGESSYVLRALGRDDELAYASVRFSFGRETTATEIERAIEIVCKAVSRLRTLSPRWSAAA